MGRGPLQSSHGPPLLVLLVAVGVLFAVNQNNTSRLTDEIAGLRASDSQINRDIASVQAKHDAASNAASASASARANSVDETFRTLGSKVDATFQAVSQSIDATNVEVELVKHSVANLGARVDRDFQDVKGRVTAVAANLAGTDARVANVAGRAEDINKNMERIGAGLEGFYADIKAQTEWAVAGPGGCNDEFKGELGGNSAWKETRSFVHTRQKVKDLEECKTLCKVAKWGCRNVSFYGAGAGWCYGFQTCNKHSTGQGWGGYTTYHRNELAPLGGEA